MRYTQPQSGPALLEKSFTRNVFLAITAGRGAGKNDSSGFSSRNIPNFGNQEAGFELHAYFDGQQPPVVVRPNGRTLYFDGTTDRQLYTEGRTGIVSGASPDETFIAQVEFASVAGTQAIVGYYSNNANTPSDYGRGIYLSGGVIRASGVTATNGKILSSGITAVVGKVYTIAVRFSVDGAIFIDGIKVASGDLSHSHTYQLAVGVGQSTGSLFYKLAGYISMAYGAQRGFSDGELASISANPWQIFKSPQRVMRTSAGGPATYSYTASGGFVLSGSATKVRGITRTATGGATFSGSAAQSRGAVKSASGGILFAGAAALARGKAYTASGGLTLSGAATVLRGLARTASGGLLFSGTAGVTFHSAVQSLVVNPVGGIVISGTAAVVRTCTRLVSGGIKFAGTSPVEFFSILSTGASDWIGYIRRRGRR